MQSDAIYVIMYVIAVFQNCPFLIQLRSNISSNQDGLAVFPGFSAYAASKGGVSSFTDAVGKEVAKFGFYGIDSSD